MSSERQIIANRANAHKSTGPVTVKGKQIVSQNAIRHGLLSRGPLIPGENPAEYQQYRDTLIADLEPQGELELLLADRIAGCFWKLRRAGLLEVAMLRFLQETYDGIEGLQSTNSKPPYALVGSGDGCQDYDAIKNPEEVLRSKLATRAKDLYNCDRMSRLQQYEIQIDNMLQRTLNQLQRLQFLRSRESSVPHVVESVLGQQAKVPDEDKSIQPVIHSGDN
jgi:hypothetical protein